MAIWGGMGQLRRRSAPRRWALVASIVWLVVVLAYGVGFLSVASETQSRGTVFLDAMFFVVAVVLPLGLVWLAAWLAEELARQREIVASLADVTGPLVLALDETRGTLAHHASPEAIAQAVGSAVGEAVAGNRAPDLSRPLADLAAGQARLESALLRLGPIPSAPPQDRQALPPQEPPAREPAPAAPAAIAPAELPLPPSGLAWEQLIRALDFPRDASDREGFRALRAAQRQPKLGQTLQAAEDVLNLLSQEGVFVDDLAIAEVEPSAWRMFMSGVRGGKVAAIGAIDDPRALEVADRLLKTDSVFRDTALFFLRRFERVLAEHARDVDDAAIISIAQTRSGRAFMLLARTSGTFT